MNLKLYCVCLIYCDISKTIEKTEAYYCVKNIIAKRVRLWDFLFSQCLLGICSSIYKNQHTLFPLLPRLPIIPFCPGTPGKPIAPYTIRVKGHTNMGTRVRGQTNKAQTRCIISIVGNILHTTMQTGTGTGGKTRSGQGSKSNQGQVIG